MDRPPHDLDLRDYSDPRRFLEKETNITKEKTTWTVLEYILICHEEEHLIIKVYLYKGNEDKVHERKGPT